MKVDRITLRNRIAEVLEMEQEELSLDADFNTDLAINSLQILDIIAEIEDNYDIKIGQESVRNLTTVNKIADELERA